MTLPVPLNQEEWELLMLLGWHIRRFPIRNVREIQLLHTGWIEASHIIALAGSLHAKVQKTFPNLVEICENRYVSLRISPDILFFPAELFRYKILGNQDGGKFRLERQEVRTPWGILEGYLYEKSITGKMTTILRELARPGENPPENDWDRNLRGQFGESSKQIGLRRLWTKKHNCLCFVEGLRKIES